MNKKNNILIVILVAFIIFCAGCNQTNNEQYNQTNNEQYNNDDIYSILKKSKGDSLIRINSIDDSIPVYKYFYYDNQNFGFACDNCGVRSIIITGNTNTVNYNSGKIVYNILQNFGTYLPSIVSDTTIDSIFIYKKGSQILYRKN